MQTAIILFVDIGFGQYDDGYDNLVSDMQFILHTCKKLLLFTDFDGVGDILENFDVEQAIDRNASYQLQFWDPYKVYYSYLTEPKLVLDVVGGLEHLRFLGIGKNTARIEEETSLLHLPYLEVLSFGSIYHVRRGIYKYLALCEFPKLHTLYINIHPTDYNEDSRHCFPGSGGVITHPLNYMRRVIYGHGDRIRTLKIGPMTDSVPVEYMEAISYSLEGKMPNLEQLIVCPEVQSYLLDEFSKCKTIHTVEIELWEMNDWDIKDILHTKEPPTIFSNILYVDLWPSFKNLKTVAFSAHHFPHPDIPVACSEVVRNLGKYLHRCQKSYEERDIEIKFHFDTNGHNIIYDSSEEEDGETDDEEDGDGWEDEDDEGDEGDE
jgi:hypothetical protein